MKLKELGRPYAKIAEVSAGSVLEADGGFTCMVEGSRHTVQEAPDGLFITCKKGRHYLQGQYDEYCYVGLYLV